MSQPTFNERKGQKEKKERKSPTATLVKARSKDEWKNEKKKR